MKAFSYRKLKGLNDTRLAEHARFLAGGTTLLDLMKLEVETPTELVDINPLPLKTIERLSHGGVRIGALVTNSDLAHHEIIKQGYAHLSQAVLAGASVQLRNKATTGGNLLQRTRCVHFRDSASACNKRTPGSGCDAFRGFNRNLAVLGVSPACIASNPSDMNVAMMAADARVHLANGPRQRVVDIDRFYLIPGATPHLEFDLKPGELITSVELPAPVRGAKSLYLKLRDRASYEFALVSVAVSLAKDESGRIAHIRFALGGVGSVPWRNLEAEKILLGEKPSGAVFAAAAETIFKDAKPQSQNKFKLELGRRCVIAALTQVSQA